MTIVARAFGGVVAPSALLLSELCAAPCAAETADWSSHSSAGAVRDTEDRFTLTARSETYVQLFRRALLPGPNGALIGTETALPVHQYAFLQAYDVDALGGKDTLDFEFAAWGRAWLTDSMLERPFDGDIQIASVRYHAGPAWVRLGRQQVAGGAARYARFDGGMVGIGDPLGFFAEGYGGFTVLPRWDDRPGYHHLGALESELSPYSEEALERASHWLAGGRVGYTVPRASGTVSLHEEREAGGVSRRNLALDLGARPFTAASFGASALFELDGRRVADARAWIDVSPHPSLDVGAELLRAEPALLLSRQSVFSVFTVDGYDELGGTITLRAQRWLRFETSGHLILYDGTNPGARGEITARLTADRTHATLLRASYARVTTPENGYHSLRTSFSRKLSERFATSLEAYGYFYDELIAGHSTSSVYAGTLSYRASEPLELLWGASIARSPYAALDAQTLLRISYEFAAPPAARRR